MKVVILAGGLGTRISEETVSKPKLMVEIGDLPVLLHIMNLYSSYGFHEFVICLGYKGHVVKDYFANYYLRCSDHTYDFSAEGGMQVHTTRAEPWKVTLVDTGRDTMTGGRVKRVQPYVGNETFMLTYGDGLSSVNIHELLAFHRSHGRIATVTATQPSGRFGALELDENNKVHSFQEKPKGDRHWINGGFFVMEPEAFRYIEGDDTVLEKEPLERLATDGELMAYRNHGFWYAMDTLKDKLYLEELWKSGKAPWIRA